MDPEHLLDLLVEEQVLETDAGGSSIRLADIFRDTFERRLDNRSSLTVAEIKSELSDEEFSPIVRAILTDDILPTDELYLIFETVGNQLSIEHLDDHERLLVSILLLQFFRGLPPADGVPEAFLPVSADLLPGFVRLHHKAIVYVWRRDCSPCDVVRSDLDEMISGGLDDISLFGVYGPESPDLLYQEYDVGGAPTLLFTLGGEVDARLTGAHQQSVLRNEIDTLRELD